MSRVNRLGTPMPDSVMDRYYAEHPDEVDHRRHKTASAEPTVEKQAAIDPEDFEKVFDA